MREYDRLMLHSALISVLWCAMVEDGKLKDGIGEKLLAEGINKEMFNRTFDRREISVKMASRMSTALGFRWDIRLIDNAGNVFTPSGKLMERLARTKMANIAVTLTEQEWSITLGAVGAILASMANDVPPGQPTPPEMIEMEALQSKLMSANQSGEQHSTPQVKDAP